MKRINPLELVGNESLDYDLYDENGNTLFKAGEKLTPEFIMMLNYKKVFKDDIPTTKPALSYNPDEISIKSIIPAKTAEFLVGNAKKILGDISDGVVPSTALCENTGNAIIEEVADKIQEIKYIGELRIYDEYTFSHTVNVSSLCSALAMKLNLTEKETKDLALGALLHDIGKMRVPKNILNKPGKLEPEEFEIMKNHTVYGYNIIKNEMNLPEEVAIVALQHQEKYSGNGYPNRLKENEISLFGQICAVADVYDALVSKRVYKEPIPSHEALRIMIKDGSFAFNPMILYKFVYLANYKDTSNFVVKNAGNN